MGSSWISKGLEQETHDLGQDIFKIYSKGSLLLKHVVFLVICVVNDNKGMGGKKSTKQSAVCQGSMKNYY